MDHDRYGLDGMPISCRGTDCDPVTGIQFPRYGRGDAGGIPHLRLALAVMMALFVAIFIWQSNIFG
ncbi:hypothetical protein [Novosphingobium mathurense]|uniref:Uncharacterized protein n=1 Tax=Novosphingobium mathurense TaxID=428990 RepID=A0A1U6IJI5_9SPHN|nr:hypothetical protein [Novosphingobium mathurense]SLK08132.1 hypothetical protein SAMN06295987_107128 [Novosphingobium mathurense]